MAPALRNFAEKHNIQIMERNADQVDNLLRQDIHVLRSTQQKALPIIYFQTPDAWAAVSPQTWNIEAAYEKVVSVQEQFTNEEE